MCFQIHRDKLKFSIVQIRNKSRQCLVCISRLSPNTWLIKGICSIIKHLVVLLKYSFLINKVCRWNPVFVCVRDLPEFLMLKCCRCNERHISGRNIMLFVVKSMWVCKMCIRTSQLLCLLVHHTDKIIIPISHCVCNRIGNFIRRCQ